MELDLLMTSSPHIGTRDNVKSIMLDVIIALIPAGLGGIFYFGAPAAAIICVSVLSCIIFEYIWQKLMHKPNSITDLSAIVTGLLLAYNLTPTMPLWIVVIGASFAIIIVKQLFGGLGHNFMNPALAGRAFLLASWSGQMTKWISPSVFGLDAVSSSTPLTLLKEGAASQLPSHLDMFLGNTGGCIGETSAVLILIGAFYLVMRRIISLRTPISFIATVAVITFIFGGGKNAANSFDIMLTHILSGGLMLGAFFMATDYTTSPVTKNGQIVMGIGCGIITSVIRLYGGYPEGVSYSIMLMNIATPLIDKFTRPRVFGHTKSAKEAK